MWKFMPNFLEIEPHEALACFLFKRPGLIWPAPISSVNPKNKFIESNETNIHKDYHD